MIEKRDRPHRAKMQEDVLYGSVSFFDQMTYDELRQINVGDGFDANCPICKKFHLTEREITLLEMMLT